MKLPADKLSDAFQPVPGKVLTPKRQMYVTRFSPCGRYLLAGGYDGRVHRWDVSAEAPRELAAVEEHRGWVTGLAFHPDKRRVVTADSWGRLACLPYADEKPRPNWSHDAAHDGWVRGLAVSADGRIAATCGMDRALRVWSTGEGKKLHEFKHEEDFFSVAIHPDGNSVVAGDLKGAVKHYDLAAGKHVRDLDAGLFYLLHRLQDVGGVLRLAFDRDGTTLAAAGGKPSGGANVQGIPTVLLFDWKSGKRRHELALGENSDCYAHDLALHEADFLLAVTSGTPGRGKLVFWRPGEEKPFYESKKLQNCHSISLSPDGRRLAVAATSRGSNGNGRRLDKNGEYAGNSSPIHLFRLGKPQTG